MLVQNRTCCMAGTCTNFRGISVPASMCRLHLSTLSCAGWPRQSAERLCHQRCARQRAGQRTILWAGPTRSRWRRRCLQPGIPAAAGRACAAGIQCRCWVLHSRSPLPQTSHPGLQAALSATHSGFRVGCMPAIMQSTRAQVQVCCITEVLR